MASAHDAASRRAEIISQLPASLASAMAPLNSSMIAVALPAIRREFDVGVGSVTWLVSAYLIGVAVAQPASGRLGDAFGHLRVIKAGLVVLTVFSIASALAWNFPLLVAMRTLQGLSAALTMPNAVAYARKRVPADRLGGVLGANGAFISGGAALGPVVGGLLLAAGDWRWLFWINIPLALLSLALLQRLPADQGAGRRALQVDAVSLGALLFGFTGITLIGTSLRLNIPALLALAPAVFLVGVTVYVLRYRRTGSGVVDLRLFSARNYAAAAAGTALTNVVMYTILIAMPNYLGDIRDLGDGVIGLALFAESVALVLVSPVAGRLADRLGGRPMMVTGALVLLTSAIGITLAATGWPLWTLIALLLLIGLGLGLASPTQQSVALQAHPVSVAGSASGTYSMMRYVGSVTGAAVLAAVIGKPATEGQYVALFAILTSVAVANVAIGFIVRFPLRTGLATAEGAAAAVAPAGGR